METFPTDDTKRCATCKVVKPKGEFRLARKQGRPDSLWPYCSECEVSRRKQLQDVHRERFAMLARTRYAQRRRDAHLRRKFGIDHAKYLAMLEFQGSVCAICKADKPGGNCAVFHVDHNHNTGEIRGLLCSNCNRLLGYCHDNPDILRRAIEYIVVPQATEFIKAYLEARSQ